MKKHFTAAGCMILAGAVIYAGSALYQGKTAEAEAEPAVNETEVPETEAQIVRETKPVAESETEPEMFVPSPDELNLAYYFPDDADTSDMTQSYAGKAFETLMYMDESWMSGIYAYSDLSPVQLAARLGHPVSDVTGGYNPNDDSHDPNDPSTWTINSVKDIRMSVTDGDGSPISVYSNVIDIMSMANVYSYYHDIEDYDSFLSYAKELWKNSHSYSISMSDIYYCSGCLDEDAQQRELEELEEEARAEAAGFAEEEGGALDGAAIPYMDEAETDAQPPVSVTITSGQAMSAAGTTAYGDTSEEDSASEDPASKNSSSENSSSENSSSEDSQPVGETSEVQELVMETEDPDAAASADYGYRIATASDASVSQRRTSHFASSNGNCPGHVDLIIHMKIRGLEDQKGLYEADPAGSDSAADGADGWEGWTEENRAYALNLSKEDWYSKYGLSISMITMTNPLTPSEIEAYMEKLPENLSETRRKIIEFALSSVGKIPYYWGGKASVPGYEGNRFGTLIGADTKGRLLKGLDCSGWINWVYWSVLGQSLPYESTSGLALLGTKISRDQLQPGDIVVRTGEDAHVIMFLGWTDDGRILCIHESSAGVNNVTVSTRDAHWPYYRSLLD